MQQYRTTTVLIILAVIVLAGVAFFNSGFLGERAARTVVTEFGERLQNVPLAGDADIVSAAVEEHYAPYVTEDLLTYWKENPEEAPGRATSSPWPDSIEISIVTEQGEGFVITGSVKMMTSVEETGGGAAGMVPVVIQVIPTDSGWKIAVYEEQQTTAN